MISPPNYKTRNAFFSSFRALRTFIYVVFIINTVLCGHTVAAQTYYNSPVFISNSAAMADFGANVIFGAAANIILDGDLYVYAAQTKLDSTTQTSGAGTLHFIDPATQALPWSAQTLDANGATFNYGVELKSSGLTLTNYNEAAINSTASANVKIAGQLTFTQGLIHTQASTLGFLPGSSHVGASASRYIAGVASKQGNTAFVFPVGNDTLYAPIGISAPAQVTDIYVAGYLYSDPAAIGTSNDLTLHHISACEYWNLRRLSGTSPVEVSLTWNHRSCGVIDPAKLRIASWNGTYWLDIGAVSFSGNADSGLVTSSPINSFSKFTLASSTAVNPLPVSMGPIGVSCMGTENRLEWQTYSEQNNDRFDIEISEDMLQWKQIGSLPGNGNSNEWLHYQFDYTPATRNTVYYRIVQVDFDGVSTQYGPVSAHCGSAGIPMLYPNPTAGDRVYCQLPDMQDQATKYSVLNGLGRTVLQGSWPAGQVLAAIPVFDLAPAVYYVAFSYAGEAYRLPFIKISY